VLLVGGSSVGKTRCAFEAVRTLLPDWRLVHPAGPTEVTALAQAPPAWPLYWSPSWFDGSIRAAVDPLLGGQVGSHHQSIQGHKQPP